MSSASNVSLLREASRQVVAGGSAGLIEICLMHPLDVVKTRQHLLIGCPMWQKKQDSTLESLLQGHEPHA